MEDRKVSFPLIVGIVIMPYIFAWFLLRKGYSTTARALGLGWLAILVVVATQAPRNTPSATNAPASSSTTDAASGSAWKYSEQNDEMRKSSEKTASVDSENTLDFAFPYNGGSTGTIEIRRSPSYGFDVILSISKGQFVCHSFTGGHINVKFDDRPIEKFGCTSASDGSSNVIFFRTPQRMLAGLKNSKKTIIETEFFNEGSRQMTFNTQGLKWP